MIRFITSIVGFGVGTNGISSTLILIFCGTIGVVGLFLTLKLILTEPVLQPTAIGAVFFKPNFVLITCLQLKSPDLKSSPYDLNDNVNFPLFSFQPKLDNGYSFFKNSVPVLELVFKSLADGHFKKSILVAGAVNASNTVLAILCALLTPK